MGEFTLVIRHPEDSDASDRSAGLRALATRAGWAVSDLNPCAWLALQGPAPPRLLHVGGWSLIGDVFDRHRPILPSIGPRDPWSYERKLVARFWGRYVGVLFGEAYRPAALLRDPSGGLECVTWEQDGLTLVSSSPPDWLIGTLRPPWRIDAAAVARALRDPVSSAGPLILQGPEGLGAGTLQTLPLGRPAEALWSPAQAAGPSLDRGWTVEEAAGSLRAAIDETVCAYGGLDGGLAVEISGGLDSSLVAASLVATRPGKASLWINAHGSVPEADERSYAAALGRRLGIAPTSVPHATGPITGAGLERVNGGWRPGLNALDTPHDLDWARRLTAAGAGAVMTGKGGDSILLQAATPDVFTDLWKSRGWSAVLAPDAARLALANETSIWTMIRRARAYRGGELLPGRDDALLTASESPPAPHPWVRDCDRFGPAKTLQIYGVADSVSRHGPSRLTEAIDVRHPLCAQPVIEACLAIPTPLLTLGARDRGLARRAFADRLPTEILERRSKGDMTQVYGRMMLDNLEMLRSWLMDGRLAALGVIDRDAVDRQLTRERFLWRGKYSAIMVAAAFEAWVRVWEGRLGTTADPALSSPASPGSGSSDPGCSPDSTPRDALPNR